ncbi:hypothetical protein PR048_024561 [Dryococelus australis]|uniref:Uncharacterized protein n=1 Tax=Dryococelus australis TaxID=614101 RepID=A0ABQ9GP00_9NEOP|nr:hypothetical protein PR048_024561 [Dryococelus australis]
MSLFECLATENLRKRRGDCEPAFIPTTRWSGVDNGTGVTLAREEGSLLPDRDLGQGGNVSRTPPFHNTTSACNANTTVGTAVRPWRFVKTILSQTDKPNIMASMYQNRSGERICQDNNTSDANELSNSGLRNGDGVVFDLCSPNPLGYPPVAIVHFLANTPSSAPFIPAPKYGLQSSSISRRANSVALEANTASLGSARYDEASCFVFRVWYRLAAIHRDKLQASVTIGVGEPGSVPGGVAPGFSNVGIVADDAAIIRVFSGFSRFSPPLNSGAAPYSTHRLTSRVKEKERGVRDWNTRTATPTANHDEDQVHVHFPACQDHFHGRGRLRPASHANHSRHTVWKVATRNAACYRRGSGRHADYYHRSRRQRPGEHALTKGSARGSPAPGRETVLVPELDRSVLAPGEGQHQHCHCQCHCSSTHIHIHSRKHAHHLPPDAGCRKAAFPTLTTPSLQHS